jgi:iron complex outermembrane recepter protein
MKYNFTKSLFVGLLMLICSQIAVSQSVVKGKVIDAGTGEVLVGATVVVKGTTVGAQTDYDGLFEFTTTQALPLMLNVTFVGYEAKEVEVTNTKTPLSIKLGEQSLTIETVEVKGQRISDKQKAAPLTVESMDRLAIKQTASVSFYEGLGSLKGVDLTTASIGFTIINTRGFNSTSPVRSLQIIDGVDNQAPGLNFSLGNFLGSSELDVQKVDLVVGASSAFYGPNAFNGVLSMETKNPFFQKGLSAQIKTGERNLVEASVRYADAFKNKSGNDFFAFKVNLHRMKAYDWVADNYEPVYNSVSSKTNPGGFDAVNIYGDEYQGAFDRTNTSLNGDFAGLGVYHREGYREIDLVDYNTKNTKANAAIHFRTKPSLQEQSPELIASSNFGSGTTVYQGDNRFSLRDILFFQHKIEYRKRDKFFIRSYVTTEDAGNSYDPYFTALLLQEKSKTTDAFSREYDLYWLNNARQEMDANGYPQATRVFDPVLMRTVLKFDTAAARSWIQRIQIF